MMTLLHAVSMVRRTHPTAMSLVCLYLTVIGTAAGQVVIANAPPGATKWDAPHRVVFFGRGAIEKVKLRSYENGRPRAKDIDVLSAFPGSTSVVVEDLAAANNGVTVVAASIRFGQSGRNALLFYNASGELQRIWNTDPYYPWAVATDGSDRVYILGERTDIATNSSTDYPVLIRYSADGSVERSMLPKSVFRMGNAALQVSRTALTPILEVRNDEIRIYTPVTNEVFFLSPDGEIKSHNDLARYMPELSRESSKGGADVLSAAFAPDGALVMEIRRQTRDAAGVAHTLYTVQEVVLPAGRLTVLRTLRELRSAVLVGVDGDQLVDLMWQTSGNRNIVKSPRQFPQE